MAPLPASTLRRSRTRCCDVVNNLWRASAVALATLSLLATLSPLAAWSAASSGDTGLGIRLVDVPASAVADPRANLYVIDHLSPGVTIQRRVEVSNTTAAAVQVLTYAAAATIEGSSFTGADGHTANELSSWTTVTSGSSVLAAGAVAIIEVTIAVPADAAPGERYGAVWAEARSAPVAGSAVVEVNRVGIRLYISVGPGAAPAADFTITSFTASRAADGAPVVSATVRNTGGRALDMSGSLNLTDGLGGLSAGPFPATLGVTLPIGATEEVRIPLDARVPDGPWHATIVLRSGLTEHTASAVLTFPAVGSADPVPVESDSWWTVHDAAAVSAVAIVIVAAIAVSIFVWRRRRRRRAVQSG